ncbi:MAG: hypothetical protein H6656_22605 [Ardenticatenaceae bacterium]|nr:hypothetical protein [Ardenticatenaceae bacterium]
MTILAETTSRLDPISRLFLPDRTTFLPPSTIEPSRYLETHKYHSPLAEPATETSSDPPARPDESTTAVPSPYQDDMLQLEVAAELSSANDLKPFLSVYRQIDWETHPAADFAQAVRLALRVGAHQTARECALAGSRRFPHHAELQKLARLLAPPGAKSVPGQGNPSWQANRNWLHQHWGDYRGYWVALRDGQLLAVADDVNGLVAQVGPLKDRNILITPIW